MVKVKICGITNWTDAKRAVDAGADLLGFNFYPRSPRYITPARARRIVRRLPRRVQAVGVFVNEPAGRIRRIAAAVGLRRAQLHGEESPAEVAALAKALPVVKAFRMRRGFSLATLGRYARASAFLLDGFSSRAHGGTGKRFDWSIARRARRHGRVFLAGGLRPENIAEAIRRAQPYAVDVCSGVETRPGRKDASRMRALVRAVRQAGRR